MAAAGPAGNLLIAFVAFVLIKIGLATGWFVPPDSVTSSISSARRIRVGKFVGELLSIFLTLNVLLARST